MMTTLETPPSRQYHPGQFKVGVDPRRYRNGRKKGARSRTPNLLRALVQAAELHGSDGCGRDGLAGYLHLVRTKHPELVLPDPVTLERFR